MRARILLFVLLFSSTLPAQNAPAAIGHDPGVDKAHPASSTEMTVPSHGVQLLGIFYQAAGAGNHPTVILLHGFPGYEQNLDLAQAIRRAGWNVLAMHYRGSWGVGGTFSLAHAIEDADALVEFARSPAAAEKFHIDGGRIVVIGHSMGAFNAAFALAHNPSVLGAVMIGTWDVAGPAREMGAMPRQQMIARLEKDNATEPADFLPLQGTDPHALAVEIVDHRDAWDLSRLAPAIGQRPVLLLTADDGNTPGTVRLEQALKAAGDRHVELIHSATDHGFNGLRIHLETMVLDWLAALPAASPQRP